MRPFSTHWTREANCMSVGISVWLCCYFRRLRLPFHTLIQASWCAIFVWPTSALTLHSQRRTVASFKEVFCWLGVSSRENEDCCPVEGKDGLCFFWGPPRHPTTNTTARPELEHQPWLNFDKIVFYRDMLLYFLNIQTLELQEGKKGTAVRTSLCLGPWSTLRQACLLLHNLSTFIPVVLKMQNKAACWSGKQELRAVAGVHIFYNTICNGHLRHLC